MKPFNKWLTILGVVAVAIFMIVPTAAAAEWDAGGSNTKWSTEENWVGDVLPLETEDVLFQPNGATWVITFDSDIEHATEQATIQNGSGSGSGGMTFNGSGSLTFDKVYGQYSTSTDETYFEVPVEGLTSIHQDQNDTNGSKWNFNRTCSTPLFSVNAGTSTFNGGVSADVIRTYGSHAKITINSELTPYTPGVTPIITQEAGTLTAGGDLSLQDAIVTIHTGKFTVTHATACTTDTSIDIIGGTFQMSAAQQHDDDTGTLVPNFPQVIVRAGAVAMGNFTAAVYGLAPPYMTFEEDAILAIEDGPEPNRADIGGVILFQGVTEHTTGQEWTVGDDGGNAVYKGLAFTPDLDNSKIDGIFKAAGGSGNLQVVIRPFVWDVEGFQNTAEWIGDPDQTEKTADFHMVNDEHRFDRAMNGDIPTDGSYDDVNQITVFNFFGDAGQESRWLMRLCGSDTMIAVDQTWNVSRGGIRFGGTLAGTNRLMGRLTLSDGGHIDDMGDTDFDPAATGILEMGHNSLMHISTLDNSDFLEGLDGPAVGLGDSRLVRSGNSTIRLHRSWWDVWELDVDNNPVLRDLWVNSNIICAEMGKGDKIKRYDWPIGHGKFLIANAGESTVSADATIDPPNPEKLVYGAQAGDPAEPVIGIAATSGSVNKIKIDVDAPTAQLSIGTATPIDTFDNSGNLLKDNMLTGRVELNSALNVKGVQIESGTARFNRSYTLGELGINSVLEMTFGETITVNNLLSGSATWDPLLVANHGNIAPGASQGGAIGTLTATSDVNITSTQMLLGQVRGDGSEPDDTDLLVVDGQLFIENLDSIQISWLPGGNISSMFGGTYRLATYTGTPIIFTDITTNTAGNIGASYIKDIKYAENLGGGTLAVQVTLDGLGVGDTDLDGDVDGDDLATFGLAWSPSGTDKSWFDGDFDFDGDIDGDDLAALGLAWAPGGIDFEAAYVEVTTVPEPSTTFLLLIGEACLLTACHKRRRVAGVNRGRAQIVAA